MHGRATPHPVIRVEARVAWVDAGRRQFTVDEIGPVASVQPAPAIPRHAAAGASGALRGRPTPDRAARAPAARWSPNLRRHPAALDEQEVRRARHLVVGPRLRGHDDRLVRRRDAAQRRDALLVLAPRHDDQPGVCGKPSATRLIELVPEAGAGAAAGGQERDEAAALLAREPDGKGLVPGAQPGDVEACKADRRSRSDRWNAAGRFPRVRQGNPAR